MSKKPSKVIEVVEKAPPAKAKEETKDKLVEEKPKPSPAGKAGKEKQLPQESPKKNASKVVGSTSTHAQPPAQRVVTGNVLVDSGLIDAYDFFLRQLCKNGLPSGNIFEYAAQEIMRFEKKKMSGPYRKGQQKIDWAKADAPDLNAEQAHLKTTKAKEQSGADKGTKQQPQPSAQDPKSKEKGAPAPAAAAETKGKEVAQQPAAKEAAKAAAVKPDQNKAPPAAAKVK